MTKLLERLDPARPRSVVVAAVLLGMAAGLVAALFLTVTGEPRIEEAIKIELSHAAADEHEAGTVHHHEDELVSRGVQRGPGLFGAYLISGGGFGLLFGVAFLVLGRGRPDVFRRALVAGGVLAGSLTVSPWLKYPPNPPAVGDPGTIGDRQRIYVLAIVLTFLVLGAAVRGARLLRQRGWPESQRAAVVAMAVVVVMLGIYGVLPGAPDAITVPATLVWQFRLASLGGNLILWSVLSVGFGVAASARSTDREPVRVA